MKLRLAIDGPSGSGKTYSALLIAQGLGGKIALIDTEYRSAHAYAHLCEYDLCELDPPYSPARYIDAIRAAESGGYNVLIVDSLSHAWSGAGGVLDIHDLAVKAQRGGNSFTAWREVTPQHNALVDAILQCNCHVIATIRTKTQYEIVEDDGKKKINKVGTEPVQRAGLEYEFTVLLDMSVDGHVATSTKDRTSLFDGKHFIPTVDTGKQLLAWLDSGVEAVPEARPTTNLGIASYAAEKEKRAAGNGHVMKALWTRAQELGITSEQWKAMAQANGITGDPQTHTPERILVVEDWINNVKLAADEPQGAKQ